jgi:Fe-S-cluster containining protein
MTSVQNIEIDEEHITIKYNEHIERFYNANAHSHREWVFKYNEDPEMVLAVRAVIELARKHLYDLPGNVACPPGCAECCSGYEPFVSRADIQRIADHFNMSYDEAYAQYVVPRASADDFSIGYLRKVEDDVASKCIFLRGSGSGRYYCGIYSARPTDCGLFTPIGCDDVDASLRHDRKWEPGPPFTRAPRRADLKKGKAKRRR